MILIVWIVLGTLVGLLVNLLVGRETETPVADLITGVIGAVIGGFLGNLVFGWNESETTDFNFTSLFVAVLGSFLLEALYQTTTRFSAYSKS